MRYECLSPERFANRREATAVNEARRMPTTRGGSTEARAIGLSPGPRLYRRVGIIKFIHKH